MSKLLRFLHLFSYPGCFLYLHHISIQTGHVLGAHQPHGAPDCHVTQHGCRLHVYPPASERFVSLIWFHDSFQEPSGVSCHRCHWPEDFPVLPLQGPAAWGVGLEAGFPLGASARARQEGPPVPHQPHQVRLFTACFSFSSSGMTRQPNCLGSNPGPTSFPASYSICASVSSSVNWG